LNQNPEQLARDLIDAMLIASGWIVQSKKNLNLNAASGVAVREYQTDIGPADYVLFVDKKPVGIIEAKRAEEGVHLTMHEDQSEGYAAAKLKYLNNEKLPFVYESTGEVTRFTDYRDTKPRSRPVFTFHRPETFLQWSKQYKSLRTRLHDIPLLPEDGLRDCQITAIINLEKSFKDARPKALIQMATGSGKTFTAITSIYRLLKYAKAKRILFLVDTKNLGEQAEQEFMAYVPNDDNRKFTELYGVTRLKSSFIPADNQVYISTIQRMYSILKGTELDESAEETNPNEYQQKEPAPVTYTEKVPIEFFDFIVIDECHRSIYNLWKQVLDYFDVFQIGLTATPDNRTFGYFNQNLVSDYGYEKAVIDGVLVPYNVFTVETKITKDGSKILMGEKVDKRERLTRRKFWESVDEDIEYSGKQLDKDIVNKSQIRTIIRAIKENLPAMFPDRTSPQPLSKGEGQTEDAQPLSKTEEQFEVPKTLIFAKSDSHAEDIIEIVREEFAEENKFCKKITYKSEEDPKTVLSQFRNDYYPRIAVTVDMIATGTDIRPLEVLVFMRDVKSRSYYEQMKGRGTRTCSLEQLKATGTPSAKFTKDHFVIIDAIGVESSQKTDSRPLEKKPGISLKDLLQSVAAGNRQEDTLTTLANRLIRMDKQINENEKMKFAEHAGGYTINHVVKELLNAHDPDTVQGIESIVRSRMLNEAPAAIEAAVEKEKQQLIENAVAVFHNPGLRNYINDVRKKYDQVMDGINMDEVTNIGWVKDQEAAAQQMISDFTKWIETHKDEITALQIFYSQPYRRRELTYTMIRDLYEKIKTEQPLLAPEQVWRAYEQLKQANGSPKNELIALVSLIRKVTGIDASLTGFDKTVDKNFQAWVFKKQAGTTTKFNEEQMQWLRMIKDYVASSFHMDKEDFELDPFNKNGGLGKMWRLFGEKTDEIINELNEVLAA
jgi:type I restriction enzyme, R subunit